VESDALERKVADVLPHLATLRVEDLETAIALGLLAHEERGQAMAHSLAPGVIAARSEQPSLGTILAVANERIRPYVCTPDSKTNIKGTLDVTSVSALVALILPAFGLAAGAVPPTIVIAVGVYILKVGLDTYCRPYRP